MTNADPRAKMLAFARRQPITTLAESLRLLDRPGLSQEERQTRAVIVDVICEQCPEADAAFQQWADQEEPGDDDPGAVAVIVAAVRNATAQPGSQEAMALQHTQLGTEERRPRG
jgi:hypothetical protein